MFNLVNVSIAFAALVIIILLFSLFNKKAVRIKKERVSFNIKGCRVIYSDTRPEKKDQNIEYSTLLKSDKYDIQGKPDFIFEKKLHIASNIFNIT